MTIPDGVVRSVKYLLHPLFRLGRLLKKKRRSRRTGSLISPDPRIAAYRDFRKGTGANRERAGARAPGEGL